ncbi:hypothetical protein ARMSODRAFT_964925, partial [Armillaria solidipes]
MRPDFLRQRDFQGPVFPRAPQPPRDDSQDIKFSCRTLDTSNIFFSRMPGKDSATGTSTPVVISINVTRNTCAYGRNHPAAPSASPPPNSISSYCV